MDGGKAHFTGKLTQSEVSREFLARVPLYFEIDGRMIRAGYVSMHGNMTSNEVKIALPKKPKTGPVERLSRRTGVGLIVKEIS